MAKALVDDDLWALIEPLLPPAKPRRSKYPGRRPLDDRAVLTGILFVLQSGIPWEMLPPGVRHFTPIFAPFGKVPSAPARVSRP